MLRILLERAVLIRSFGAVSAERNDTFGESALDKITAQRVREWHAECLRATKAKTTIAKMYRLLKSILGTAADDDLIKRNPCRIRGAGKEKTAE